MLKTTESSDVLSSKRNDGNDEIIGFGVGGDTDGSLNQKIN